VEAGGAGKLIGAASPSLISRALERRGSLALFFAYRAFNFNLLRGAPLDVWMLPNGIRGVEGSSQFTRIL
jgi:hypothetical protein